MPTMPNVIGLEYEAALASMVTAGVRVLPLGYFQNDPVTLIWSAVSERPYVVSAQNPSASATVAANSAVSLTVSSPPMSVASPAGQTNV